MKRCWVVGSCLALVISFSGCGGTPSTAKSGDDAEHGGEPGETTAGEPAGEGKGAGAGAVKIEAPAEGASAHESRNVEMQFDLTLLKEGSPSGMQSGSWSVYEERTMKVLGTKDKAISKLELVFGRREAKALLGVEKPSHTAGKTYVIEASGAEPSVKTTSGKDAPANERSAVSAEYGWIGRPSPLLEMLAELKPGASTEPPAEARRVLIGELPGIDHEHTSLSAKLVSVEGKSAKLDVTLKSELDNGDMDFTLELAGPAVVDTRTGFVKSLDLSGKVTAKGSVKHQKKPMEARGKGSAKISRKAELR